MTEPAPLPGDLACWLIAAFPQRAGRFDTRRAAATLEVSPRTIRRWLTNPAAVLADLRRDRQRIVRRRAILRGRGHYQWPPVDAAAERRAELNLRQALDALALLATDPGHAPTQWRQRGWLDPYDVLAVHLPRAAVWQIAISAAHTQTSHRGYVTAGADHQATLTVPNRWAAAAVQLTALTRLVAYRCTPPTSLVPHGRSYCWRDLGPAADADKLAFIGRQVFLG